MRHRGGSKDVRGENAHADQNHECAEQGGAQGPEEGAQEDRRFDQNHLEGDPGKADHQRMVTRDEAQGLGLVHALSLSCELSFVTGVFGAVLALASGTPGLIALFAAAYAGIFAVSVTYARRRGPAAPYCAAADAVGPLIDARIVLLLLALAALVTGEGPYGREGRALVLTALMLGAATDGSRWGMLAHRLDIPIRGVRPLLQRVLR